MSNQSERRAFPRSTVRTPGEISFAAPGGKPKSYICTVVNISEGGALLEIALPEVPNTLRLSFRGQEFPAEVVERAGSRVHVRFVDARPSAVEDRALMATARSN